MSEKLLVKYLSPETGVYEYASVVDIGDLDNLKTSVKTDLVSAINSITLSGEVPANIQSQIDEVNTEITSLKNAGLTQNQLDEIQAKIDVNIIDIIGQVNIINDKTKEDFDKEIKDLSDSFDGKLATTENDYNTKVSDINLNLSNAKQDIDETKIELDNAGARLNNIDLNYVTVTQNIDRIDGELTTKVNSTDFDLMQAKVTENTTQISQTKDEIQTLATKTSLDLATERITKAESDIHINADGISSRVTYQEMNTELQKVSKYGDNLLTGTRNWDDIWTPSNVAYTSISSDTYRHCRVQVVTNKLGYYSTVVDNLEVGETYTASIYYKSKDDSQLTNIVLDDEEDEYLLDTVVENTSTINGWRRVSVSFVPIEKSPTVSFKFGFLASTDIGYLAGAKIELGVKASEWKPHYNDDNESILKNESSIKQNSESIVTLVTKTERMDGDITDNRTQISQTAEDVSLQATKITEIDGKVSENTASLVVANDAINTKVSQTDVDESIASINLDTKNRILNSDFSREWNDWSEKNDGYSIQKIDGVNFAHISRTGLTNVSIASVASAKFQVSNNEKLNFSFMFMADTVSGLDDKNIFTIELFDISDVRVMSKTFNTSELATFPALSDGKVSKLSGKYVVNRSDVAKARVKIQLNKNGSVYFSKIYLQKGDVKESEWSVAPEDLELYRTEMQTEINQNSDKIELRATKTEMDEANRSIQQNTADIVLSNGKIEQIVTDYTAINGRVSQAESSITQNANAITQKVSSTDVENILTGKAYATKSELTQTSNSLTSTISGVQSNVNALGTNLAYAYSADGTDGFTTVYPNLNLLEGTKDFSGTWLSVWTTDGTYKGLTVKKRTTQWSGIGKIFTAPRDGTYTFSAYIKSSGNTANIFRYCGINSTSANAIQRQMGNNFDWIRDSVTLNLKANDTVWVRYEISGSGTDSILWTAGHKWEQGSIATPWMPSASEVKTSDYPKYIGRSLKYSTNPSDYKWEINSGYTDAKADVQQTQISQMSQDLDGFKTTVSNTYLSKSDASSTYADKNSVASQITQSATAVTSNVQTWTNNRLTSYSTTQQTTDSITNAVANKADKSQITQLSNQITSIVTDVSAIQVGGQNLLLGTATAKTNTITQTNNFSSIDLYNFSAGKFSSFNFEVDDYITLSFDWETTSTTGNIRPEINLTPWILGTIISGKGTNGATLRDKTITASEQRGHIEIVFKVSSSSKISEATKLRLRFDGHQLNSTFTIKNAKLEKGNKATDWCMATQEVANQSQITQLSDNINLKVSKGGVISSINQEAGQIVFNANKLVLNANTTEITGNAFIRGDMIVDGSIKAGKLEVSNLSSLSSNLGDIKGGSYTSWSSETVNGILYLNGIYLYNGRIRSLNIQDPSSIDPDKKGQLSEKKCRGTEVYSGDTHLFDSVIPQLSTASPNDILKGNEFWDKTSIFTYCGKISGYRTNGTPHTKYSSQHHIFEGTLQAKSMSGNVGGIVLSQGSFPVNVTPNNSLKTEWGNEFSSLKLYGQVVGRRQFTLEINMEYVQELPNPDIGYRPYTASAIIGSLGEGVNNREWMVVAGINAKRNDLLFRTYYRDGNGNWSENSSASSYIYLIIPMIY